MGTRGYELQLMGKDKAPPLKAFPDIDADMGTLQANALFTPYLFYHWPRSHKYVELWCSSCLKHGTLDNPPRTVTAAEMNVLYGRHNDKACCPWCGREVTMKETGRLGKRKKLLEHHPVVYLKEKDGDLYARAYWARKDYQGELDQPPKFFLVGAYYFGDGLASYTYPSMWRDRYETITLRGNYDPVHRKITEPFMEDTGWNGGRYIGYTVFGLDEIQKSRFRYCRYEQFEPRETNSYHWDLMKYMAACSIWPRQIEMLMKTGFESLVDDLVQGRRKNTKVIKWGETDYLKAFGLSKQELHAWRDSGASPQIIGEYKILRNKKLWTSFEDLAAIEQEWPHDYTEFLRFCKKRKLPPRKVCAYLTRFVGGCSRNTMTLRRAFEIWRDYLNMAEYLDYDLGNETVFWPRDLFEKHDAAAEEQRLKLLREKKEQDAVLLMAQRERIKTWQEKYNFSMGEYFIRVAESASEIVAEGKTLSHCVGGYAERHMAGRTTILFLRRIDMPSASLYTIEMQGNQLQQIHGYKNEVGTGARPPRQTMAWMLEPWLAWLKKGSPRDKEGNPKLPKPRKKKQEEAKIA